LLTTTDTSPAALTAGKLMGVGRLAGDALPAYFNNFQASFEPASPNSVVLDYAAVFRSRDFGVMATNGYATVPEHLRDVPGFTQAAAFTLRNGSAVQGDGRSYRGNPLMFVDLLGV